LTAAHLERLAAHGFGAIAAWVSTTLVVGRAEMFDPPRTAREGHPINTAVAGGRRP
jgi:hypothetical protein